MSDLFRIANQPVANVSAGNRSEPREDAAPDANASVKVKPEASTLQPSVLDAPIDQATKIIESVLDNVAPGTKLRIDLDQDTGRFVYQSIDQNGEVVKQFPPEQILKFLGALREVEGLVLDAEA